MLDTQRHLFDIPDDVAYLNCAYISPLMRQVRDAGRDGIEAKVHPWTITSADFFTRSSACRALFAQLINTAPRNIAIVPSASYGIAVAARNLPLAAGRSIVVLEDQFPSNVYTWRDLADRHGAEMRTVSRSAAATANRGVDWTPAVLDAIDDATAIVALPHCHWTDGALLDLERIAAACRARGAALVLDITQSGGVLPFDVEAVRPDFLVCACYKWLLGPYSLGFLYADPSRQDGEPLEMNWIARRRSEDFTRLVDYADDYQDGALRYDMGERSSFHLMPMADAALRQILDWRVERIAQTLRARTTAIAERALALGMTAAAPQFRAGHFLGLRFPHGLPPGLPETLAARNIHVSVRGDSMRVTPHLYNTDEDVDRLFAALESLT